MKKWLSFDLGNLELNDEDMQHDLVEKGNQHEGIFGRIGLDKFLHDLEQMGLLERLRQRGYQSFRPVLEKADLFSERLKLFGKHVDYHQELRLMDVKSHRASLESPWKERYRSLGWDWVEMQDPTAQPSIYRPTLPGQKHPGLGMFRSLTRLMLGYVEHLGLQALSAIPMYFHNAVLYSETFWFLDATVQGRFQAMCRDLLHNGLACASWWVDRHEIELIDRSSGEIMAYEWPAAVIVRPLCEELHLRLQAPEYLDQCQRAMEAVEFRHRPPSEKGPEPPDPKSSVTI